MRNVGISTSGDDVDRVSLKISVQFICVAQDYFHPRRPRGSQSCREKGRDESFQVRVKEPLGTDSHRAISKNSS